MKNIFSIVMAIGLSLVMVSCRSHPRNRSIAHVRALAKAPLGQVITITLPSKLEITLLNVDLKNARAEFQLVNPATQKTAKEWVTEGEFFRTLEMVGTHGLQLETLSADSALLTCFGAINLR